MQKEITMVVVIPSFIIFLSTYSPAGISRYLIPWQSLLSVYRGREQRPLHYPTVSSPVLNISLDAAASRNA